MARWHRQAIQMTSKKSPMHPPSISHGEGVGIRSAQERPRHTGTAHALMLCVSSFHLLQEAVRTLDRRVHRTIPGPEMKQQGNNDAGANADTEKHQQDSGRMHSAPPVSRRCIIVDFKSIQIESEFLSVVCLVLGRGGL